MLKRKLKICRTCKEEKLLFSGGQCEHCSKLKKLTIKKEPTKPTAKPTTKSQVKKKPQTIAKLKKEARYWFQRWIRLRDLNNYCIYGCGNKLDVLSAFDAAHYLKFEIFPLAGFDENNVHGACKRCNILDPTQTYRRTLIKYWGEEKVNEFENQYLYDRKVVKWEREYLQSIINKYKALCKEIESK